MDQGSTGLIYLRYCLASYKETALMAIPVERRILMLQGPASWFPTYLGRALQARGADVHRILLCPGDWLFWRCAAQTTHYRSSADDWPEFIDRYIHSEKITDLVCLGDGRRWHCDAIDQSVRAGVRTHIIEQGYIRPACLTVEPLGTGGNTRFPREWCEIERLAAARRFQEPPAYSTSFSSFAAMDVAYNLANILLGWLTYPQYRTHALEPPLREWAGWVRKALRYPVRRYQAMKAAAMIAAHNGPVFLLALQLETDFQIRHHGPPGGVKGALTRLIDSFAAHAPLDALLVVKPHPLDNGGARWRSRTGDLARDHAISERVVVWDGGTLDAIRHDLSGLVTVNSTTGLSALRAGASVCCLGKAIYDLPGLTHQGSVDSFWRKPQKPAPKRVSTLLDALWSTNQVPGNFDGNGAKPGANAIADRILSRSVL